MYFNVNFNVFFKLIKVRLLVSELYVKQSLFFLFSFPEKIRLANRVFVEIR